MRRKFRNWLLRHIPLEEDLWPASSEEPLCQYDIDLVIREAERALVGREVIYELTNPGMGVAYGILLWVIIQGLWLYSKRRLTK